MLASVGDSAKLWSWKEADGNIQNLHTYRAAVPQLYCLGWSHTNLVLAVAGKEAKVHLLHTGNGQLLSTLPLSDSKLSVRINTVAFSHSSRYLATSLGSPIQLWDLKAQQVKSVFTGHQSNVVSIQFVSSGNFYAADESGCIKLWSNKSIDPVSVIVDEAEAEKSIHPLTAFTVSPLNSMLVSGYDDGAVRIWNSDNSAAEAPLHKMQTHSERITSVSCSKRNPRLIATASIDEYIHLLDINAPSKFLCSSILVDQKVTAVDFHEDGIHCAAGTASGSIQVFDWRNTSEPVATVNAHDPYPVYALAFQNTSRAKEGSAATLRKESSSSAMAAMPIPPAVSESSFPTTRNAKQSAGITKGVVEELMPIRPPPSPLNQRIDNSTTANAPVLALADHSATKVTQPTASAPEDGDEVLQEDLPAIPSFRSTIPSGLTSAVDSFALPMNLNEYSKVAVHTGTLNMSTMPGAATKDISSSKRYSFMHMDTDEMSHNASMAHKAAANQTSLSNISPKASIVSGMGSSAQPPAENAGEKLFIRNASLQIQPAPTAVLVSASSGEEKLVDEPSTTSAFEAEYNNRVRSYVEISQDKVQRREEAIHNDARRDIVAIAMEKVDREFAALKESIRPVTHSELEEAIELLKYDIHEEVQQIIREQIRQFSIARDETAQLMQGFSEQLKELIKANKELREENQRLRNIY